jgi:Domain of unknown function (DUF4878)
MFLLTRVILCALALGILVSCASRFAGGGGRTRRFGDMLEESPSALVKAFLAAVNEGRYSDAEEMLSEGARYVYINGGRGDGGPVIQPFRLAQPGVSFRGICDQITKNGSIAKVVIVKEEIDGEAAQITVDITYKDGSILNYPVVLEKEEGAWKQLTLEVQPQPQH